MARGTARAGGCERTRAPARGRRGLGGPEALRDSPPVAQGTPQCGRPHAAPRPPSEAGFAEAPLDVGGGQAYGHDAEAGRRGDAEPSGDDGDLEVDSDVVTEQGRHSPVLSPEGWSGRGDFSRHARNAVSGPFLLYSAIIGQPSVRREPFVLRVGGFTTQRPLIHQRRCV